MSKMARDKGKRGEREVAELLRDAGWSARRGQQFAGGGDSPDVVSSLPGVHIEVKRTESLSIYEAMAQANEDKREGEMATVWHKRNGKEWLVVMSAKDFLALMEKVASV